MSAPMENMSENSADDVCEIEATVTTGFEPIAMEEAAEKLNAKVETTRGRIIMKVPMKNVKKVLELGCVDNCYVLMTRVKDFHFSTDELESMAALRELVKSIDWDIGLKAWHQVFSFKNPIKSKPDVIPDKLGEAMLSSRIHKPQKGDNGGKKSKREKRREKKEKKLAERKKLEEDHTNSEEQGTVNESKNQSENESRGKTDMELNKNENENICDNVLSRLEEKPANDEKSAEETSTDTKPDSSSEPVAKKVKLTEFNPDNPSFRVTCHRSGDNHSFDSMGAASNFGGAIYNYFKWNVSMKEFDIEVMLYIDDGDVRVGLALTKQSLHRRNTTSFGPTTLRPTIAYNMLRMCKLLPGEIVCDPMCGSGVIPIQTRQVEEILNPQCFEKLGSDAALDWPDSIHLCGEIVKKGLDRTVENIEYVNGLQIEKKKPEIQVGTIRWDACNLPLRSSCVDVFITDLPFGIRMGSKAENSTLYPRALHEMSRVTTPKTGRVCLLTQDKKGINKAMQLVSKYWKRTNAVGINMGGLAACVYMMYRNSEAFDSTQPLVIPDKSDFFGEHMKKGRAKNDHIE